MAPPRSSDEDSDSTAPSSPLVAPAIARRTKFDDEEDDSDVIDSWDAAEDSEVEAEKAKKVAAVKAKADAEALANKKSKAQRIEERRVETMRRKAAEEEYDSTSEEDESSKRLRIRQTEQDSDLKHAEDLFGNIGISKDRSANKAAVTVTTDPSDPTKAVDLSTLSIFNPSTKDQFLKLREALVPILTANSKKAHYTMFLQEFTKQIVNDLPSEQIKKIASGLATLSNEKMKEEKLAEKGGKKSKAAKTKAALVATRDVSSRADTTLYGGDDYDDGEDFM